MAAAVASANGREWPTRPSVSKRKPATERRAVGSGAQATSGQNRQSVLDQDALDFLDPGRTSSPLGSPIPVRWPESVAEDSDLSNGEFAEDGSEPRRSVLDVLSSGISGIADLWPGGAQQRQQEQQRADVQADAESSFAESETDDGDPSVRQQPSISEAGAAAAGGAAARASVAINEVAEDLSRGFQRLTVDLSDAVTRVSTWREEAEQPEPDAPPADGRRASVSSSGAVDTEQLLAEARGAFKQLLAEVPELKAGIGPGEAFPKLALQSPRKASRRSAAGCHSGQSGSERDAREAPAAPAMSAIVRTRLVGHLVNCCEAISCELSQDQAPLWRAFVARDLSLRCALPLGGLEIQAVLQEAGLAADVADNCAMALCEQDEETTEADFVDVLDAFTQERRRGSAWSFPSTLRSSILNLLGDSSTGQPPRRFEGAGAADWLRERCPLTSMTSLASAAAAYQRCFILVASWRTEQRILGFLRAAAAGGSIAGGAGGARGWPPEPLPALMEVLRGIKDFLSPTERVLWELLSEKVRRFDGTFHRQEVVAVMEDLVYRYREDQDEEELQLRSKYQQRSIDNLFHGSSRRSVTLADILKWWWEMTPEFREGAGFILPKPLVSRALDRCVEEMFRTPLRRLAEPKAARAALHGCSRAFAELCSQRTAKKLEVSFDDLAAGGYDDYREMDSSDMEYLECQHNVILT